MSLQTERAHQQVCLEIQKTLEEAEAPFYRALSTIQLIQEAVEGTPTLQRLVTDLKTALAESEAPWDTVMERLSAVTGRPRQ